jgi:release factor glutamine methyltransferase
MLRLKQQILNELRAAPRPKSVEAEAELILYHFFRNEMKTGAPQVTPDIETQALEIARRRATGIPLQHLLGYQFFYEHEYRVSPAVLIPRPETEILVQAAIGWVRTHGGRRLGELGLGSGILSAEILHAVPGMTGVASELSLDAQSVTRENLATVLGPTWNERLKILTPLEPSIGFEILLPEGPFDLIVSNPPYVSHFDEIEEEVLRHEPHLALFPDASGAHRDPNAFYLNFLQHARALLAPQGAAFLEIPHERADFLATLPLTAGLHAELIPDLTGRSRVLKCTF